jgi:ribosomal protein S4E
MPTPERVDVKNGDACIVIKGTHQGRKGTVQDLNVSKSGNVTITVKEASGERFKTLARNVKKV